MATPPAILQPDHLTALAEELHQIALCEWQQHPQRHLFRTNTRSICSSKWSILSAGLSRDRHIIDQQIQVRRHGRWATPSLSRSILFSAVSMGLSLTPSCSSNSRTVSACSRVGVVMSKTWSSNRLGDLLQRRPEGGH
jgi:hypothetical protein